MATRTCFTSVGGGCGNASLVLTDTEVTVREKERTGSSLNSTSAWSSEIKVIAFYVCLLDEGIYESGQTEKQHRFPSIRGHEQLQSVTQKR